MNTLELDLQGLRMDVAYFLGKGRDATQWSDADVRVFDMHIASGLRMFYSAHPWSFLMPWNEFETISGQSAYALPDDFAFLNGDILVSRDNRTFPMLLCGETQLMSKDMGRRGVPRLYAVTSARMDGVQTGQRFTLNLWPVPDAAMTVRYRYAIAPRTISVDFPYPYGGQMHSETIREACLAAAESDTDDQLSLHQQKYQAALATSVARDREASPDTLGYNGDGRRGPCDRRRLSMKLNGIDIPVPPPVVINQPIYWEE